MSTRKLELSNGFLLGAKPSIQLALLFELYEPVFIGGIVTSSDNIELVLNPKDNHYLMGFRITANDTSEATIDQLMEKANRLTDYIGFKTNTVVHHKRPRIIKKKNGKTETTKGFTSDALIVKDIELDINKLSSLLSSDSIRNQHLAHYREGLESLLDNNFSEAIKDFFLIIENAKIPEEIRYKCLRDAVSHNKLDNQKTLDDLRKEFGINLKKGEYLNINNPDIQNILETEAKNLREMALKHLSSLIS